MATGEFEVAKINFESNRWSYVVFIAFLFMVSTVLLNFLHGLAASNASSIKSETRLTNLIRFCQLLARYEKALLRKNTWFR